MINDSGDIVGAVMPGDGSFGAFGAQGLLIHNETQNIIMPLGATSAGVWAISQSGILGGEMDSETDIPWGAGFVGRPQSFTRVDYAGPLPPPIYSMVTGVTDNGTIVGPVLDALGAANGFYRLDGEWYRIGYGGGTWLSGVNESGVAVGYTSGGTAFIVRPKQKH